MDFGAEETAEFVYKATNYYHPESDRGVYGMIQHFLSNGQTTSFNFVTKG